MIDNSDPSDRPSKSQLKKAMTALQDLGELLVELPAAQLEIIPLPDVLSRAVHEARRLKSREARRRQMQYIGRLMREVDPEPIESALASIKLKHQQARAHLHQIEQWRDQLIAEGDKKIEELINTHPDVDAKHLRQLVHSAQQQKKGAATELFRFLRDCFD